MMEWHVIESSVYYDAETSQLNNEYLYFLSDTGEIMKGTKPFNQAMEFLAAPDYAMPSAPARNRIYIHPITLEGKVYDGTNWNTVIRPVSNTVTSTGVDPVSGKAVFEFVAQKIADVTGSGDLVASLSYNKNTMKLTYTKADDTSEDLLLEGIGMGLAYDKTTGALTLKDISGNVLGTAVNLDLERFVSAAAYDNTTKKITLTFNDNKNPLEIPVGDLVDTYTAESSNTVSLTVTGNKFKAEAVVASTAGNMLQATEDGLYVAATDLSSCQKLVANATANNVATLNATGQVVDGGVAVGGAALADAANATTLATEIAVKTAIAALNTTLTTEINKKMAKITGATNGDVLTVNGDGQAVDSGKKIGGAALAATPDENTLATEAAVKAAVTAMGNDKVDKTVVVTTITAASTDDEVPSAKAVRSQLEWKTTL